MLQNEPQVLEAEYLLIRETFDSPGASAPRTPVLIDDLHLDRYVFNMALPYYFEI